MQSVSNISGKQSHKLEFIFRTVLHLRIGGFRKEDDDNENVKKAIGLITKTTTLRVHYTFFLHFFAVTARLGREIS